MIVYLTIIGGQSWRSSRELGGRGGWYGRLASIISTCSSVLIKVPLLTLQIVHTEKPWQRHTMEKTLTSKLALRTGYTLSVYVKYVQEWESRVRAPDPLIHHCRRRHRCCCCYCHLVHLTDQECFKSWGSPEDVWAVQKLNFYFQKNSQKSRFDVWWVASILRRRIKTKTNLTFQKLLHPSNG